MSNDNALWPKPTRKRFALAIYLDFLFFSVPITLIGWFVLTILGVEHSPFFFQIIVFGFVESVLFKFIKWSPGMYCLGIQKITIIATSTKTQYSVDPRIHLSEAWWTILLGAISILDGAKLMQRWTIGMPSQPIFGFETTSSISIVLTVIQGLIEWIIGIGILRMHRFVLPFGLTIIIVGTVSNILSWELFPAFVEKAVSARRTAQGRTVSSGELEFMVTFTKYALIGGPFLGCFCLWLLSKRLGKIVADEPIHFN